MKKLKQTLAWLLVLCMVTSFLPASVFAAVAEAPTTGLATNGSPFQKGTGESNSFRIPALVTLSDGTLVAAADARWNTTYDGGGLDTMVAISKDNGATWTHSFANYLGDNGNEYNGSSSTCFIDPALTVVSADTNNDGVAEDTIYMLCDLYPYGIALNGSGNTAPNTDTGFTDNGKLKLTADGSSYSYYLDGTVICNSSGTEVSGLTVDAYFNVTGTYNGQTVNSNLFFADSPFKVARTGFLYLTKSTDKGATWSAPQLLNLKTNQEMVCLVGPGRGIVAYKDEQPCIVFPIYSYNGGDSSQRTGFIYSDDEGATWNRVDGNVSWSSESAVVELWGGTLRFFFRNGSSELKYVDYTWDGGWSEPQTTGIATNSNTQISAITLQKTVDDQQVILVSCPAGPDGGSNQSGASYRTNGKIFLFTVGENNTMTKQGEVSVPSVHSSNSFMYSCMTALADEYGNETGDIAILYEDQQNAWGTGDNHYYQMSYKTFNIDNFGVTFGGNTDVDVDGSEGESYEKDLSMKVGQTITETVEDIFVESDTYENDYVSVTWTGTEATTTKGIRRSDSAEVDLTDCLFTFTDHETEGYYVVESSAFAGRYLNNTMPDSSAVDPISATPGKISLTLGHTDMFRLQSNNVDDSNYGDPYYAGLHFHTESSDPYWDRCGNDSSAKCHEYLYRAVEAGETSSTEIPGYIRLTSLDDVQSGGEYLIAHTNGTNYYVLYPGASQWECVVKVNSTTNTAPASTTFNITAKKAGETTVELSNGAIWFNITIEKGTPVDVQLKVNETKDYTIDGANHENNITRQPDNSIVTMTVDGTDAAVTKTLSPITDINAISADKQYVIECVRAATSNSAAPDLTYSVLTSTEVVRNSETGLQMDGPRDANSSQTWTITASNGKYSIGSGSEYIKMTDSTVTMESDGQALSLQYVQGSGWLIYVDNDSNGADDGDYFLSDKYGATSKLAHSYNVRDDGGNYWAIYEVVANSTPASTTVTFTGVAPGNTTAVVGNTQYNITVASNYDKEVNVNLEVGKTQTYTDETGNYQNSAGNVQPDASIATMTVTGVAGTTETTVSTTKATELEAGATYIIRVFDTNYALSSNPGRRDWGTTTRAFEQNNLTANEKHLWTLEAAEGGYKLKSADGYLSLGTGNNAATLDTDGEVFTITSTSTGWTIGNQSGRYINALGGLTTYYTAGGWTDGGTHFDLYKVTQTTDYTTSITFQGVAPGTTTAVVGNTLYNITVTPAGMTTVDIELEIGESFTYTDTTGNHVDKVTQQPNGTYATMAVSGSSNSVVKKLVPVTASTFQTGKRYVIENVRAANPNHSAYQPNNSVLTSTAATGGATGLVMNGPLDANTSQTWTFTPNDNMYFVGRDNSYITLNGSNAYMSTTAQSLSFEYVDGSGWLIYYNQDGNNISNNGDYFLSDVYGTSSGEAFGYTTKNDDGNYWNIYEVVEEQQLDATRVTFIGVAEGETTAIVGNTQYNITVVPAEVDDEVMNSATDIWTVDPEIQRQRYNTIINGKYKDLYTDESWKQYEAARQAAYKKLVEVTNAKYDSKEKADAALAELKTLIDTLKTKAEQLVSATTISVHYTYNGTELDIWEYKIASTDTSVTLPETIVVDDIAYKVTDTTLERQGAETSYNVRVTLIGKVGEGFVASGNIELGLDHNNHNTVCELKDTTTAKKITEMTLTVGIFYDLDLGLKMEDGYTVDWVSDNDSVATVDQNGLVTAMGEGVTYITATIKDANDNIVEVNSIPVTVFPKGSADRKSAFYIENIDNTTVWCVVNGDADNYAFEVVEGELIYGQFDKKQTDNTHTTAMSFFGDPDEAHALVYMKSTDSDDHYFLLHDDDRNLYDGTVTPNGNYYVSGQTSGAGYWQAVGLCGNQTGANTPGWSIIKDMVQWAINQGCDGGLGFTRRQGEKNLASNLSFKSDPMPRIEKVVDGVLPTTRKQANYRRYVDDMVAAVHELVYFKITVTQEVPTEWQDTAQTVGAIVYSNAWVKDTVLPGAYLYTKELDQADGTWDGEISEAFRVQEDEITDQLNDAWTAEQKEAGKRVFEFYLMYEIQESDIPKFYIDNIANLDYNYESHYSTGAQAAAADAEARISVVGSAIDNVVIDFGQSFTYQSHPYYNADGTLVYTFGGLTNSHLKGAYVDGEYDANGKLTETANGSGASAKYGDVKVYRTPTTDAAGNPDYIYTVKYTPTAILQEADAVRIYGVGENGQKKLINGFLVYPATTVYYEEGFLEDVNGWNFSTAKKATTEQTFELLGVSQFDNHGTLTHYISNKKQAYGFDPIYDGISDNGEVDSSSISSSTAGDIAKFTFTGTGFEIFADCTENSGYVAVTVTDKNGNNVKMFTVNTVVKGGTGENNGATSGQTGNMDALPIVSLKDLEHGTYTVTLTKVVNDGKTVTIDGVRITNTVSDSSIYNVDLEDNPEFYQLRDAVMNAIGIFPETSKDYIDSSMLKGKTNEEIEELLRSVIDVVDFEKTASQVYNSMLVDSDSEAPSAVITDTSVIYGENAEIQDLLDNGPKNEIYLWPNQTLTFKVATQRVIQVGLKAPSGATGFGCTIRDDLTDTLAYVGGGVYGATDMFYYLTNKPVESIDNTYVVSITNMGENVLAITDLKVCDDPNASFVPLTLEDVTDILRDAGYTDSSAPEAPLPFEDVPADAFYYEPVAWAVKNGITNGISDTRFAPDNLTTRGQIVTFLWRAAGEPEPASTTNPFADVDESEFYYKAILWAVETGITNGVTKTTFNPDGNCTRAQAVTFLYRYAGKPTVEGLENPFEDISSKEFYYNAILWAVKNGITTGVTPTTFVPDATCTRGQIVSFLYRHMAD